MVQDFTQILHYSGTQKDPTGQKRHKVLYLRHVKGSTQISGEGK